MSAIMNDTNDIYILLILTKQMLNLPLVMLYLVLPKNKENNKYCR